MKSLLSAAVAPLLLVLTALIQAMGWYPYLGDGITLVGQLLFPIVFALLAVYLARKGRPGAFATVHLVLLVLAALLLVLTLVGMSMTLPQLYPSMILYYIAFALVAIECALRIAGLPKRPQTAREPEDTDDAAAPEPLGGSGAPVDRPRA